MADIVFATCSWKYKSWQGIVYSNKNKINFLEEYAEHFSAMEVDQWFRSLYGSRVVLPKQNYVLQYKNSVPNNFRFFY